MWLLNYCDLKFSLYDVDFFGFRNIKFFSFLFSWVVILIIVGLVCYDVFVVVYIIRFLLIWCDKEVL